MDACQKNSVIREPFFFFVVGNSNRGINFIFIKRNKKNCFEKPE